MLTHGNIVSNISTGIYILDKVRETYLFTCLLKGGCAILTLEVLPKI